MQLLKEIEPKEYTLTTSDGSSINTLYAGERGTLYEDKKLAQYSLCTHDDCKVCGSPAEKIYTLCFVCRNKYNVEKYEKLEYRGYDGSPVYCKKHEKYFASEDDIEDFLDENPDAELRLVFCEREKWPSIDDEYFTDDLGDENDNYPKLPKQALDLIDELNQVLQENPPDRYSPGSIRTTYFRETEEETE
jgi:hypothetical protein